MIVSLAIGRRVRRTCALLALACTFLVARPPSPRPIGPHPTHVSSPSYSLAFSSMQCSATTTPPIMHHHCSAYHFCMPGTDGIQKANISERSRAHDPCPCASRRTITHKTHWVSWYSHTPTNVLAVLPMAPILRIRCSAFAGLRRHIDNERVSGRTLAVSGAHAPFYTPHE